MPLNVPLPDIVPPTLIALQLVPLVELKDAPLLLEIDPPTVKEPARLIVPLFEILPVTVIPPEKLVVAPLFSESEPLIVAGPAIVRFPLLLILPLRV